VHLKDAVNIKLPVMPGAGDTLSTMKDLAMSTVPGKEMTVGLYRLNAGPTLNYTYTYEEFKFIVEGEWILTDGTGQVVHAKAGDLMYFPMGTNLVFDANAAPKTGLGYYMAQRTGGPECDAGVVVTAAVKAAMASNPKMVHFPQIAEKTHLDLMKNPSGSRLFQKDIAFSKVPGKDMTAGLYREKAGPAWKSTFDYEDFQLIRKGKFHIKDGTGQHVTAKAGDLMYFPKGTQITSKVKRADDEIMMDEEEKEEKEETDEEQDEQDDEDSGLALYSDQRGAM